ncbi:MAG: hypothetical protein LUG16_08375, partial [Candidatus Gastranaerophilales bacterium]|nr:hypothetical protein [Candidatus Gastranaerophilales bacterium]
IMYVLIANYINQTSVQLAVSIDGKTVVLSTFFVVFFSYIIGIFSGVIYSGIRNIKFAKQIDMYAKRTEKLSLQSEADSDDKEVLKRKIAALEIALDNALKNK